MKKILTLILVLSCSTANAGFFGDVFGGISDLLGDTGIFHKSGNGADRSFGNMPPMDMIEVPPDGFGPNPLDPTDPVDPNLSAVPVPAAVWLFFSGLMGLVAIARRKK